MKTLFILVASTYFHAEDSFDVETYPYSSLEKAQEQKEKLLLDMEETMDTKRTSPNAIITSDFWYEIKIEKKTIDYEYNY